MTVQSVKRTEQRVTILGSRQAWILLSGVVALLVFGAWNLEAPPLWWDEGWTLSLARNWVERGLYGHLLAGEPTSRGLGHAFPVNAMVALSFKLLGVGIWQGRLVGVIFMVAVLLTIYHLARRLYDQRVALGTLFVLLFMSMHPQLHPLIVGRQVLAEPPMLFFLLAGYLALLVTITGDTYWFIPVMLASWGIGTITKAQPLPFWAISLIVPLIITSLQHRWRYAKLLALGLVGSFLVSRTLLQLQQLFLQSQPLPRDSVHGLYGVTALVLTSFNRTVALKYTLTFGLPTLLGLCYATWRYGKSSQSDPDEAIVRLSLLTLAGSWFAWYTLLSVGVPRYLFPATFVGSIFVAAMLHDMTGDFDVSATIKSGARALGRLCFDRQHRNALLAIVLIAMTVPLTSLAIYRCYITNHDTSALQVANFLNTQTEEDALIETYESELHFLLERNYHYPPDQLHVELNRRSLLGQDVVISYDPLAADPDYLVVGDYARGNDLYGPVLQTGGFRLLRTYGGYEIHERVWQGQGGAEKNNGG